MAKFNVTKPTKQKIPIKIALDNTITVFVHQEKNHKICTLSAGFFHNVRECNIHHSNMLSPKHARSQEHVPSRCMGPR